MKRRTTIYVDAALLALARAKGIRNVSEWFARKLEEEIGRPSEERLHAAAVEHAQIAEAAFRAANDKTAEKENLRLMASEFARHPRTTERHELQWILARRTGFGFHDRDPRILLSEIRDALRDQPEVG